MTQFELDSHSRYTITGYPGLRPFSSFLPGIAGLMGIPLWVFYVNRGQAIASFGIESKDSPIMEYQPANKAYRETAVAGFRTFLKIQVEKHAVFYEPFAPWNDLGNENRKMAIGMNDLIIQEINPDLGTQIQVQYFTLPNEPFAGLVRELTIKNLGKLNLSLEIIDGLPRVIPYGVNNFLLKEMGRTVEAWMEVANLEANIPFYRLSASVIDRAEVETYRAGHFGLAFVNDGQPLRPLIDPAVVFGQDTSLYKPDGFINQSLATLLAQPQINCGRTPCGFFTHKASLRPDEELTLYEIYGHIGSVELLSKILPRVYESKYIHVKHNEAVEVASTLTQVVDTHTSSPIFDAYTRQNFLDNVLRGGWPITIGGHIFPVYSRKHGDLERDYNSYFIAAEPFSQGEGSYRDINQNRRSNVLQKPEIGDFDIRAFISLIQIDGYNPRAVKKIVFTLRPGALSPLSKYASMPGVLENLLSKPFTPGGLLRSIFDNQINLSVTPQEFIELVIKDANPHFEADFHEGYWIDHWEYNLDLIESYLSIYPDKIQGLLFSGEKLPFFDSHIFIKPRLQKYILVNGQPRQHNSLFEDLEKKALDKSNDNFTHWLKNKNGETYKTSLFSKLVIIVSLKFATMDPWGMGIEMEAGRPGWDDALNGLPALFGSGMAETYELARWLKFMRSALEDSGDHDISLPIELIDLLTRLSMCLDEYYQSSASNKEILYWDAVSTAREEYRLHTRIAIDGKEIQISTRKLDNILASLQEKVTAGINLAVEMNNGIPPTYIRYDVDDFDLLSEKDDHGYPFIRPKRFTPHFLPLFLEGPTRAYKILPDEDSAACLYRKIRESGLFDRKLKMYKLNASLEGQPHEIGRARAFPPGWLENESIWLHMEYKYLLEILKAGLYEQFFVDMKDILVPFMDPHIYGRSTLENSSFIVSSAHPDKDLHGAGFVARLSGSTAEFISIWNIMMAGKKPFIIANDKLYLALRPILPGWLFTEDGYLSFQFAGRCQVIYHNPDHRDLTGASPSQYAFTSTDGKMIQNAGPDLPSPFAEMIRKGTIHKLDVWF